MVLLVLSVLVVEGTTLEYRIPVNIQLSFMDDICDKAT